MDVKLKSLINICKQSGNIKKLAIVSFILTSNTLDEIGIKIGMRPREKTSGEAILSYMKLINSVLNNNFQMKLIDNEIIQRIKIIEIQFIKRKGDIPIDYIKEVFSIYYDLRKLNIPNLYDSYSENYTSQNSALYALYSSKKSKNNKSKSDRLKSLILHKLKEEELSLQKKLNKHYDRELFENAIYLKNVRHSIKNEGTSKIEIKGNLKDNMTYQRSLENLLGYSFIGAFILFFLLGLVIGIEAITNPSLAGSLSILLLISFGTSTLFFVLYWNYFWRQDN